MFVFGLSCFLLDRVGWSCEIAEVGSLWKRASDRCVDRVFHPLGGAAWLAMLFMFVGVMKFVMSIEEMTKQIALPGWFLHFIGASEILGAIGLVLPGILRIRIGLTPLAAAALVVMGNRQGRVAIHLHRSRLQPLPIAKPDDQNMTRSFDSGLLGR